MGKVIETERLLLKGSDPQMAAGVLNYYLNNRQFFEEWEPSRREEFFTSGFQRESLAGEVDKEVADVAYRFWLYRKGEDRIIGMVVLNNLVRGAFQSAFLGYNLDEKESGKGFMGEALKRVIDFAFNTLKLHRIEANIMPRNKRSIELVRKLGFHNEGLAIKYLKINGVWEDHIHMVLLNNKMD